jgi:hypothetical protein
MTSSSFSSASYHAAAAPAAAGHSRSPSLPQSHSSGSGPLAPPQYSSSGTLGLPPSLSDDEDEEDFEDDIYPDQYGVENEREDDGGGGKGQGAAAAGEEEDDLDDQRRHLLRLQKIHERQSGQTSRGGGGDGREGREKPPLRPRSLSELSLLETHRHVLNWQDFMVPLFFLSFSPFFFRILSSRFLPLLVF